MSTLATNSFTNINGTGTITLPTGNILRGTDVGSISFPGSVAQVVNATLYTPTAVAIPVGAATNTNIPDFTCSITPKSASSKVLVQVRWFGELSNQTANWDNMFGLKRNGVAVGVNPNTAGGATGISMAALGYYLNDGNSTPEICSFDFWDSPNSTSAVAYQIYANCTSVAYTLYTNRTVTASSASYEYGSSTITLWEIAQ
jgi:hypothetical protein